MHPCVRVYNSSWRGFFDIRRDDIPTSEKWSPKVKPENLVRAPHEIVEQVWGDNIRVRYRARASDTQPRCCFMNFLGRKSKQEFPMGLASWTEMFAAIKVVPSTWNLGTDDLNVCFDEFNGILRGAYKGEKFLWSRVRIIARWTTGASVSALLLLGPLTIFPPSLFQTIKSRQFFPFFVTVSRVLVLQLTRISEMKAKRLNLIFATSIANDRDT